MLHVFEFRDDRISRENVWLDGGRDRRPTELTRTSQPLRAARRRAGVIGAALLDRAFFGTPPHIPDAGAPDSLPPVGDGRVGGRVERGNHIAH